jgi:Protein of unknown function (DUF2934)
MATKRVSPGTKTVRRKAATPASKPSDGAAGVAPESPQSVAAVSVSIDPDARRQLVAAQAYFLAERRGFAAGHEIEDWVAAEMVVDSQLERTRVA